MTARSDWFLAVHPMVNRLRERTQARIVVKPMASDPVFWDLVGHPELRRQGLSFRYLGAMTVGGLILEEPEISEEGGAEAMAGRLLAVGEQRLETIARTWTVDDFLSRLPVRQGRYYTARLSTLLAFGRLKDAERLAANTAAAGGTGGFVSSSRGSINDMATRWIEQKVSTPPAA